MTGKLEAFQVERVGSALVVAPRGDSHGFRYDALHHEHAELHNALLEPGVRHLVVDLGNVEFLGSLMLGVIIKLSRDVKEQGGQVVLCSVSEPMQNILQAQNLTSVWRQFAGRDEALQSLEG